VYTPTRIQVHNLNRVGKARETKAAERLLGVGKQPTTEHALHYFRYVQFSSAYFLMLQPRVSVCCVLFATKDN
jgi:hypothetical protein